ncbi:MAG: fieF [Gemmatimonadetes bacterium]|nr:fieF [Gemmatimonadota bacterium]
MATSRGVRLAQVGLMVNSVLAIIKLAAGVLGNSYALVADAVESLADLFSSLVVWRGIAIAQRGENEAYPFGYGKAEAVASAVVGLMLVAAALGIGAEAVREIRTPHHAPAPFTLLVLIGVVAVKEGLFRFVLKGAEDIGSGAVAADAWHHRSDAITSLAAFIGISVALVGGSGWESADDVAALLASGIILFNGSRILRPAVDELMDRAPVGSLLLAADQAARAVPGVLAIEKLRGRKHGRNYYLDLHVQADPALPLRDAHILSGMVKTAIRTALPSVANVLVHMEPFEP